MPISTIAPAMLFDTSRPPSARTASRGDVRVRDDDRDFRCAIASAPHGIRSEAL